MTGTPANPFRHEAYLVAVMSAVFFFFGMTIVLPHALLPSIMAKFDLRPIWAGVLLSAGSCGYVMAVIVAGVLVDRLGHKAVLLSGAVLAGASLTWFGWVDDYPLAVALMFLFGAGGGALEVVPNAALMTMGPARAARLLNIAHLFFGVGAFIGPLATGAALTLGIPWPWVFVGGAASFGILALLTLPCRFPRAAPQAGLFNQFALLRSPPLLALSLLLAIYVGVEIGVSNWLTKFLVSEHQRTEAGAAAVLSVYWLAVAAGRLVLALTAHRTSESWLILIMAVGGALTITLGVCGEGSWTAASGFVLAGFCIGGIYPMAIAWGGRLYTRNPGTVCGIMALGGAAGGAVLPWSMSALANVTGSLPIGMMFYIGLAAAMVPCTLMVMGCSRRWFPDADGKHGRAGREETTKDTKVR